MVSIGKYITEERMNLGLTQAELADYAGLSVETVSNYEKEKGYVILQELNEIAKALGVSTWRLMR